MQTYTDGRLQIFVSLCEKIGLPYILNKYMQKATRRPMDIPPGVEAMILMPRWWKKDTNLYIN